MKSHGFAALLAACVFAAWFAPRAGAAGDAPARAVRVTQVWSRPALAGDTGVVYATIAGPSHTSDRLVSVTCAVATAAELHESSASMPMQGMEMHEVAGVPVPAGGHALLAPGGYHVMLIGLRHALVVGRTFPVTFVFERAGPVTVRANVRPL